MFGVKALFKDFEQTLLRVPEALSLLSPLSYSTSSVGTGSLMPWTSRGRCRPIGAAPSADSAPRPCATTGI